MKILIAGPSRRRHFSSHFEAFIQRGAFFLLLIIILGSSPGAAAQSWDGMLSALTQPRDYIAKRSSSYDPTGGNIDYRPIPPGSTLVLLDAPGPGEVRHLWLTIDSPEHWQLKTLVLRIFSLQYQFNPNLMAEADYFGSKGTKLTSQIIDNTAVAPGPIPFSSRQIYPQYAPYILNGYNEFGSWYDGAAFRLQKRFSHGLTYLISYTYSKNIDYVDNLSNSVAGATSNPTRFNAKLNRGLAGFDIRNVLVASGIWQIPGRTNNKFLDAVVSGWRFGNIFTLHSGLPFSVIVFTDYSNIGTVGGRYPEYASLVGNPNAIGVRTPQEWFNTAAFADPASGTYGTAGRDILHTDGLIDDDVSLSKEWKVRERTSIELRGEFFNIFNNVNFGYPDPFVDDGAPFFGSISSTLNPGREVQLALKIHF